MSLHQQPTQSIPEETQRVARAAFPKGNLYMRMRDELGEVYTGGSFAELFPERGQPAESPGRLAWVTVLQFAEGFDLAHFTIDWEKHQVTCPGGQTSRQWCERPSATRKPAIQVRFSPTVCQACPSQAKCTHRKTGKKVIYHTVKLTNVSLTDIFQYADADTSELEDVSFVFRKIEIENKIGKTVAVDDVTK